jgi:multiple sugar transport system permease protein
MIDIGDPGQVEQLEDQEDNESQVEANNHFRITKAAVAVVLSFIWLVPILAMAYITLKPTSQLITGPFWGLPESLEIINNFQTAWTDGNFGQFAINSFLYATVGGGVAVFFASMAGFTIGRLDPPGKNGLLYLVLLFTFFPFQMYLIPLVRGFQMADLFNSKLGMIIVYTAIAIPFATFVLRNYFITIPKSLYEAARIDGLSKFQIYWRVYMPLAKPALAVAFIFQWVWIWNEFLFGLVLTSGTSARPIATGLASLGGRAPRWSVLAAGTLLTVIPSAIVYITFQKYFEQGLLAGAEKG